MGSVVQLQCPPADAAANNILFGDHCYNTTESPRKLKRRLDETTDRLDDTKRAKTERRTAKKKVNHLQTVTRTVVTNVLFHRKMTLLIYFVIIPNNLWHHGNAYSIKISKKNSHTHLPYHYCDNSYL